MDSFERNRKREYREITECPECGSQNIVRDYRHGDLLCATCSIVIDEITIDQGPEWRAFNHEQSEMRTRTGSPATLRIHDKGLSTFISFNNRDSSGKSLPESKISQFYRLRQWQKRIRISNRIERNLSQALQELERMASALELPADVREIAASLYRNALKKNLVRGRSIEGLTAASLYAASRIKHYPRTLSDFSGVTLVRNKEIGRLYRLMRRSLELSIYPAKPEEYVSMFCSRLVLSQSTRETAARILREAEETGATTGKNPTSVAAAAIYMSCQINKERRTQSDIAEATSVTEVTIRNRCRELARLGHIRS